jgi:hypothetical protein
LKREGFRSPIVLVILLVVVLVVGSGSRRAC